MANFFKDYQNEVKARQQEQERQERERRENEGKTKQTLRDAVWEILTDMSSVDLIDFLESNGYIDLMDDAEQYGEDLEDEINERFIIVDDESEE